MPADYLERTTLYKQKNLADPKVSVILWVSLHTVICQLTVLFDAFVFSVLVESCSMEMTRNAVKRYCELNMIKMDGMEAKSRTIQITSRDQMIELVNDIDSYRH